MAMSTTWKRASVCLMRPSCRRSYLHGLSKCMVTPASSPSPAELLGSKKPNGNWRKRVRRPLPHHGPRANSLPPSHMKSAPPMNAILGATELLQETELAAQQRGYLDIIDSNGHALLDLLN